MKNMIGVGVKITDSNNSFFGRISGIGVDTLVEIEGSHNIKFGELKHFSAPRRSALYLAIINILYKR
ncbi:hypothetical protein HCY45_04505 [Acinetobacter radioresistens]|uniref:hypothetical protein n=1 Tax=Acinetobacter radioresistens TaxID=40216 RepID=UPI002003AC57|nr:hypothetical protein [Acinetobacter radioresistens]MCK4098439.1 hypothetical protein [Acinetobacter radioresistens]